MASKITFHGGINEIGGNKFLLEDRGTRVFLDFGMQMGKANDYFSEFSQPRGLNGMGDLFEFGLLPRLSGIYRRDYSKHMDFDNDHKEDTQIHGVLLTHAHIDHGAYIHYLRPEIPVFCTEATKLILQGLQETGSGDEYLIYKENFRIYKNKKGEMSRASKDNREVLKRDIRIVEPYKKFNIDSIEVEPLPVDHSLPGVCGFVIHTSKGSIGYTADLRFHGRRKQETEKFVEKCSSSDLDHMLCEGTRINEPTSSTEFEVESDIKEVVNSTEGLVVVSYPTRDLDRLLSFYNAAKETGRQLVVDLKQAYLLKLFENSQNYRGIYPKADDKTIKIFIPRKSWGLIDKDRSYWTDKQVFGDYDAWEQEFIDSPNSVNYRDVSSRQSNFMFYCSDFRLQELIDVRPKANSSYVRSATEPFDDEMKLDHERIKRWLVHFGLLNKDERWNVTHVSGHGSEDQIRRIVQETKAKNIIPIHTEHEEHFKRWHDNVTIATIDKSIEL